MKQGLDFQEASNISWCQLTCGNDFVSTQVRRVLIIVPKFDNFKASREKNAWVCCRFSCRFSLSSELISFSFELEVAISRWYEMIF